jgi:hypothetical protein
MRLRRGAAGAALTLIVSVMIALTCAAGRSQAPEPPHFASRTGDVVVRVIEYPGFVFGPHLGPLLPKTTLYGDGQILDSSDFRDGRARLRSATLGRDRIGVLLKTAKRWGLLDDKLDFGSPGVSDLETVGLILKVDGRVIRHDAYALSLTEGDRHLSAAQRRARKYLRDFLVELRRPLGARAAEWNPVVVSAHSRPDQDESNVSPRRWPLSADLATAGGPVPDQPQVRCYPLRGRELSAVSGAAVGINEWPQSRWRSGAKTYLVVLRPILPDESPCTSREQVGPGWGPSTGVRASVPPGTRDKRSPGPSRDPGLRPVAGKRGYPASLRSP